MSTTYSPTINVMIKAAEKAARSLLRDFNEVEKLQVSQKSPGDFVSKADLRSEEIIYESLLTARPDNAFLMEEGGAKNTGKSDYTWIIDPLDGTSNFLYGIPHWCISIALKKGNEVIAGVVLDPVKDELFRAEKGQGAFMNRTRLRVSGRRDLMTSSIAIGGAHGADSIEAFVAETAKIYRQVRAVRRLGACALELSYVAAGRLDGFWERRVYPWDMAAGSILVKEAAGKVSDLSLGQSYLEKNEIIAGNPHIYQRIVDVLALRKKAA